MINSTRIFSFGLGHAPSRSLIKGLARTTNGCFVFIPPGANVDVYVGEQLQKALQPCITNIRIKLNVDPTLIDVVPTRSPPIFINDRRLVYVLLKNVEMASFDHDISLELYSGQCRLCEATVNRLPNVSNDGMIARLAAKSLISELEHSSETKNFAESSQTVGGEENKLTKEQIRERIVEISLKYNILSPYTAFVGVEKRTKASDADMVLREVPIQISAGDQYLKYLETKISQMRHEEDQRSQVYYSAQSQQHHYYQLYDELRHNIQPITMDYDDNRIDFHRICQGYRKAQVDLSDILEQYSEARQHSDPTRIRNDYEHVRDHLDQLRIDQEEARQNFLGKRTRYEANRKWIGDTLNDLYHDEPYFARHHSNYGRSQRNSAHSLQDYDRAQNRFLSHLTNYDEIQRRLDDVVQSVDKLHQKQREAPVVVSEAEGQQLPQDNKKIIYAAEKQLQMVQVSLEDCEDENQRISRCWEDTHRSMNQCFDQLQAAQQRCEMEMEPHRDRIEASSSQIRSAEAFVASSKKETIIQEVTGRHS